MTSIIKLRRTNTPSVVPTVGQLKLGELVLNTFDGSLYTLKDIGVLSVIRFINDTGDFKGTIDTIKIGRGANGVPNNLAIGNNTLISITGGFNNIAIGLDAGTNTTTGNNNILIGIAARASLANTNNSIVIGNNTVGEGNDTVVIGNSAITRNRFFGVLALGTVVSATASATHTINAPQGIFTCNNSISITVNNTVCAATAIVICVLRTNTGNNALTIKSVTPNNGNFVLRFTATPTSGAIVSFTILGQ